MSLPTTTVTGTFVNSDGTPCQGTVEFIPGPCRWTDADATIIGLPVTATLDDHGFVYAELIATDGSWTYRVRVRLTNMAYSFDMEAPPLSGGGGTYGSGLYGSGPYGGTRPINLADVTPVWSVNDVAHQR